MEHVTKADKLKPIAEELGVSMTVVSIAWCLSNNVPTVLLGTKITKHLEQTLEASEIVDL
ncbi:hypothetical protein PHMEG_00018723 [Phytophthora megakarya]|uniref:NADP-dependent oxidoreductase domain-containing protein n=1 Tax=Phytophthora megakarya TaxID=4795 RepID=A0A225VTD4_9STRA|nr:hypothetical protein PHMEG_00018723 [Phytophthora megakarya]